MVRVFSMESQDMRMCKTEAVFSGEAAEYNNNNNAHRGYDEDCFGDILNMLDFPMESLEVDGFADDWASKLGPIPSEVFKEVVMPPPGPQIAIANNYESYDDLPLKYPVLNDKTSQLKDQKPHPSSLASFEAPSPNSVLESRTPSSNNKGGVSFGAEISIPVRTRTKRLRPTTNTWLSPSLLHPDEPIHRKRPSQIPVTMETKRSPVGVGIKKCLHCEITQTPQWRAGPMGPKTLCNACGVRYRSGRLYPEYRPAASPTFVPAVHSNCHRKVVELRRKVVN